MRRLVAIVTVFFTANCMLFAQAPLKQRPDAFPPLDEPFATKSVTMAATMEEMDAWDRYPTYETYLAMMQHWQEAYPALCRLDTIGYSIQGRLILSMEISSVPDGSRPEFFYSSTIHGDEVTGYVMMLRLIDTLLSSYGTSSRITDLIDNVHICINPLANPDGTYYIGNHTVRGSVRYNADGVDLNRTFPDPFGTSKPTLPVENEAMIDYVSRHHFLLSANLHGGSEVMNYPWDCFTSWQNPHPQALWWREVGERFVDSARAVDNSRFQDVNSSGVIAGGDWYVIHGGRQDYMNYYHNCLEMTMEVSTVKTLSSNLLPHYWNTLAASFINYIEEIYTLPQNNGVSAVDSQNQIQFYPNPVKDRLVVRGLTPDTEVSLLNMMGKKVGETMSVSVDCELDMSGLPAGIYLIKINGKTYKIIKL